jgi:hypothetical protein
MVSVAMGVSGYPAVTTAIMLRQNWFLQYFTNASPKFIGLRLIDVRCPGFPVNLLKAVMQGY